MDEKQEFMELVEQATPEIKELVLTILKQKEQLPAPLALPHSKP